MWNGFEMSYKIPLLSLESSSEKVHNVRNVIMTNVQILKKYPIGSWVWRWYPPKAKQKLGWTGPYLVINQLSDITYRRQRNNQTSPSTEPSQELITFRLSTLFILACFLFQLSLIFIS